MSSECMRVLLLHRRLAFLYPMPRDAADAYWHRIGHRPPALQHMSTPRWTLVAQSHDMMRLACSSRASPPGSRRSKVSESAAPGGARGCNGSPNKAKHIRVLPGMVGVWSVDYLAHRLLFTMLDLYNVFRCHAWCQWLQATTCRC